MIFLATGIWGQYEWNPAAPMGGGWDVPANWLVGGGTATSYPGASGQIGDTATINSGNISLTVSISETLSSLTVNGGGLLLTGGGSISVANLTMTGGALQTDDNVTAANIDIANAAVLTDSINFPGGSGSLYFDVSNNVQVSVTAAIAAGSWNFGSRNITVTKTGAGNVTLGAIGGTGDINLDLSGTGVINTNGAGRIIASTTISNSGSLLFSSDLNSTNLSINASCILDMGIHDILPPGNFTNSGTLRLDGGTPITKTPPSTGGRIVIYGVMSTGLGLITAFNELELAGGGHTIPAGVTMNALFVSGGAHTLGANTTVTGGVTLSGGNLNGGAWNLSVGGNWFDSPGAYSSTAGTVTFNGAASQSINSASSSFWNIVVNKTASANTVSMSSNLHVGSSVTITQGNLNLGTNNLSTINLTIDNNGTLNAGSGTITLNSGTWTRNGNFSNGGGTVVFGTNSIINSDHAGTNAFNNVACTGNVIFAGSNTFNNIACGGGTITFANNSTQTITTWSASAATALRGATTGSPSLHWGLLGLANSPPPTAPLITITDCESPVYLGLVHSTHATNGGNNIRVFSGGTFTWNGNGGANWNADSSWDTGYYPLETDATTVIIVPVVSTVYPEVNLDPVDCRSLAVDLGAQVDLRGSIFSIANALTNDGTIMLYGRPAQVTVNGSLPPAPNNNSTIHYYNTPSPGNWIFGNTYGNLIVANSANMDTAPSLTVNGTATIGADITATGGQIYNGQLILTGAVNLTGDPGTLVRFVNTVNGPQALTITDADVRFDSTVGNADPLTSVTVNAGTAAIYSSITTTTGGQAYNGPVVLGGTVNLTGNAGTLVHFVNTVNGPQALTVTAANVRFDSAVGNTAPLASVTVNAGTAAIYSSITTTTGGQAYNGPVVLGGTVNLTGNAGTLVHFVNTVNGPQALTVTAANVRFDSAVGNTAPLASVTVNAGTAAIYSSITTTTGGQAYNGPVVLGGTVNLTGNAGTLVHFVNTVNGPQTLTVTAANVRFDSAVGNTAPLASVTVNAGTAAINANITTTGGQDYGGAVTLRSGSVILRGGGNIWFRSTLDGDASGYDLTIIAGPGNITFAGAAGGTFPLNNLILGDGAESGTVNINNNINAALVIFTGGTDQKAQSDGVERLGDVRINAGTKLTVNGSVRQWNGSVLTLMAGTTVLDTNAGSWYMGSGSGGAGFSTGFAGLDGNLSLQTGTELVTRDFYNAPPGSPDHTVAIGGSNIRIAASGNVIINKEFTPVSSYNLNDSTLEMTGTGTLSVRQSTSAYLYPYYWAPDPPQSITLPEVSIGNFIANGNTSILGNTNLYIRGNLTIRSGRTLNAGSAYVFLFPLDQGSSGNRWIQEDRNGFNYDTSHVEFGNVLYPTQFTGHTYSIEGDTTWWTLACHEDNATLQFSNFAGTAAETVFGSWGHAIFHSFEVSPRTETDATAIKLTRINNVPPSAVPPVPFDPLNIPPDDPSDFFWYMNLVNTGRLHLDYVEVRYSFSKTKIPLPAKLENMTFHIYALPYCDNVVTPSDTNNHWNVNWFQLNNFIYAYTEDVNHNGRIDRIRLQAAFNVIDPADYPAEFGKEKFDISVRNTRTGDYYEVLGYRRVETNVSATSADLDSIYVTLKEMPYPDTGDTLFWRVERNKSLWDLTTFNIGTGKGTVLVGQERDEDHPVADSGYTIDTAPPRINYTMAVPGKNEFYIQFSESPAAGFQVYVGGSGPLPPVSKPDLQPWEFVYELPSVFNAATLESAGNIVEVRNLIDLGVPAEDLRMDDGSGRLYYLYPSPKYPQNYLYNGTGAHQGYVSCRGAPPWTGCVYPANRTYIFATGLEADVTHRPTDILVSIPPQALSEPNYFVWPLWARYDDSTAFPGSDEWNLGNPFPGYGYMSQDESNLIEQTIIWDFTGKRYLERNNILMQSHANTSTGSWYIVYGLSVPDSAKSTTANGSPELWNPGLVESSDPYYVHLFPYDTSQANAYVMDDTSSPFYIYPFSEPNGNVTVEFYFNLPPSDLFSGRLDIPSGTNLDTVHNWYRLVRPFKFDIHDITRQRGGVTILNNVINSNNSERVYLDYKLEKPGRVTIQVFTLDGNLVKSLKREYQYASSSYYRVSWDGTNQGGRPVARGMYFIRVVAPGIDEIRKVMVIK